jgi:hypothetical protein
VRTILSRAIHLTREKGPSHFTMRHLLTFSLFEWEGRVYHFEKFVLGRHIYYWEDFGFYK